MAKYEILFKQEAKRSVQSDSDVRGVKSQHQY